ncbi:MAG: hypothetical protein ACJ74O_15045 [Frankiaceae bacterium]
MKAIVGTVSMDRAHFADQQAYLHDDLVPALREQPGSVDGYWMYDEGAALGRVLMVLDSEADARRWWSAIDDQLQRRREMGISFVDLHLVEVLAHAGA